MALRGTLKDFGIADIFQLIGHQGKTGTLTVRNRDQHVLIHFKDGNVIRAESATREQKDLLGRMLVRAEIVTEDQLAVALENQKNTLRRLGDILVESGAVDKKAIGEFMRLQTTETIYRLFLWDNGTYEFKAAEVVLDASQDPIRSENVLMEGFRQVDEWPAIRKKIAGYGLAFYKLADLDELLAEAAAKAPKGGDDGLSLDDAFAELGDEGSGTPAVKDERLRNIGQKERLVYALVAHDRDVQKIIDLSRLGEFETCKALVNLIDAQILEALPEGEERRPSATATVGGITSVRHPPWVRIAFNLGLVVAGLVGAVLGAIELGVEPDKLLADTREIGFLDLPIERLLGPAQEQRIRHALVVFRAEVGEYPTALEQLVDARLLRPSDLEFPWRTPYGYERLGDGYRLRRPLY